MASVEAALREAVGRDHVLTGPDAAAWRVDGRVPRWVAFPGRVEEVSRLLQLAAAERLAVIPVGGATQLGLGNPPRGADLVIDLRRLERVLGHEPEDLIVTVEAGVRLGALAPLLARHDQLLPLDPPLASRASVGGVIATNATGPWRHRYGTVRDLLLGVTVVGADGTVIRGGGRVVKNVTGYDMPKLHVGALGSLGLVVAATLRLHPLPAGEATWLFGLPSAEALLEASLRLLDAPLLLDRLELVEGGALRGLGLAPPHPVGLAVHLGSVPEAVSEQGAAIAAVCREAGGTPLELPARPAEFWAELGAALLPGEPERSVALRVGLLTTDLVKGLRLLESAAREGGWALSATAAVGVGLLRARLSGEMGSSAVGLLGRLREAVAGLGGVLVIEHAPPAVKGGLDVWGEVGPSFELMRRLKAEFDPLGLLNPGRFVGGL